MDTCHGIFIECPGKSGYRCECDECLKIAQKYVEMMNKIGGNKNG